MTLQYANNAISRLKTAITAADTGFSVLDGEGAKFPLPAAPGDYFLVTLDDRRSGQIEICKCTARSGDVLTVERAQEGTVAQDFLANATVANRFTAGTLFEILQASGYTKPEADVKFVDVTGDTMTGPLLLPSGAPPNNQAATTKLYVDAQVATKIGDAPSDANTYGRMGAAWVTVVNAATYTASDVLAKLLTVDGAGSGLDADLLDGHNTDYFATQTGLDAVANDVAGVTGDVTALDARVDAVETANVAQDAQISANATAIATKANIDGPTFTGDPKAPTPAPGDNDTSIATTAFVTAAVNGAGHAPLASPTFTGDPKAPTPAPGDNDTSIATTAFITNALNTYAGTQDARDDAQDAAIALRLTDAPADGLVYGRKNNAWSTVIGGAHTDDAPPAGPLQDGQLWWQSSTGAMFIWFDDGTSQQWVQVTSPSPQTQPLRQTFNIAGVLSYAIPVPSGAKHAKIGGRIFGSNVAGTGPGLRLSLDGSTFFSGATDYVYGGSTLYTGSSGSPTKSAPTTASYWSLGGYTNRIDAPFFLDVDVVLNKGAGQLFSYRSRAWSYHDAATAVYQDALFGGYTNHASFNAASQVAALQIVNAVSANAPAASSILTVDWTY